VTIVNVEFAVLSKKGNRSINEDYIGYRQASGKFLFCLADGLGGHGRGEVASEIVVTSAMASFDKHSSIEKLAAYFTASQTDLMKEQLKAGVKDEMKSTLTLLFIDGNTATWGHVGDSRLYLFRRNKVIARTLDHSVPQVLVSSGEIREKDIRFHEDRNRLLRVMGMEWNTPKYELSSIMHVQSGDAFLLCSDGFWELIDEKEMAKQLKKAKTPQEWLGAMEGIVLKNGKNKNMDNYSSITIFIR